MPVSLDDYETVPNAARRTGYSVNRLRELARSGEIEARRLSHIVLLVRASVDAYVADPMTRGPYPKQVRQ